MAAGLLTQSAQASGHLLDRTLRFIAFGFLRCSLVLKGFALSLVGGGLPEPGRHLFGRLRRLGIGQIDCDLLGQAANVLPKPIRVANHVLDSLGEAVGLLQLVLVKAHQLSGQDDVFPLHLNHEFNLLVGGI
jgi:hypothetical protein